jgi:AmpD protein
MTQTPQAKPFNPTHPHPTITWSEGWCSLAQAIVSPNFGSRPQKSNIDLLVLHSISLPPGEFSGNYITELFTNQLDWDAHPYFQSIKGLEVSCHFLIKRDGSIVQYVSCNERAWHAGNSCYRGRYNCNDDSIGVELEGLEGGLFTEAQYCNLVLLTQTIIQHYPISHIAGHEHIAPGRKFDPGAGFDWLQFSQNFISSDIKFPSSGV